MSAALIAVGGVLQVVGYAITALELRQTRRRLRADLVPFPGYQAVDFSQTTDSASVRRPTLDERLTTVEREVGAVAHRLQTSEDEAVTRRLRDEAASALASRDFRAREPMQWASAALFAIGVAASVLGALVLRLRSVAF